MACRRLEVLDLCEQVNYQYDALNRLMQAVTSDNPNVTQWGQSFTYDGFGNLTQKNVVKNHAPSLGNRRSGDKPGDAAGRLGD